VCAGLCVYECVSVCLCVLEALVRMAVSLCINSAYSYVRVSVCLCVYAASALDVRLCILTRRVCVCVFVCVFVCECVQEALVKAAWKRRNKPTLPTRKELRLKFKREGA